MEQLFIRIGIMVRIFLAGYVCAINVTILLGYEHYEPSWWKVGGSIVCGIVFGLRLLWHMKSSK